MTKRLRAALALTTAMLLCAVPAAAMTEDLTGTAWLAEDIEGRGVLDRARTTLEFAEPGRVGGHSGCNRYFGPVTLGGGTITFGNLASTRMACVEAVMDQETRFFRALAAATRLETTHGGQMLVLYSAGGEAVLRLSRIVEK